MKVTDQATTGSLAERVAARQESLSAAERRVAIYLADFPDEVAFASAGTLGEATGTSDATVIRTVKSLGYAGLPALKRSLQHGVRERLTPAGRLSHSLDTMGSEPQEVLQRVLDESVLLIEQAQRALDPDSFAKAVELISNARETVAVGVGGLGVLCEYLALRLTRINYRTRAATSSGFTLADHLLGMTKDDVLVALVHQVMLPEIDVALDHARSVGAKVVLLTDTLGPALADRVDVRLSAPIVKADMFSIQTSTLALIEALATAIAARNREPALAAMRRAQLLRDRLRFGEQPDRPVVRRRARRN